MTYGKGLVYSMLLNVNYLSDFPCPYSIICFLCMWFCWKDLHVLYSLLPISSSLFLPAPVGPERECVCLLMMREGACIPRREGVLPGKWASPVTLSHHSCMAERTGEPPQQASGPSPMGSLLAMVETAVACLHLDMALAKGISTFTVYKSLLFTRINLANNYWVFIICQTLC